MVIRPERERLEAASPWPDRGEGGRESTPLFRMTCQGSRRIRNETRCGARLDPRVVAVSCRLLRGLGVAPGRFPGMTRVGKGIRCNPVAWAGAILTSGVPPGAQSPCVRILLQRRYPAATSPPTGP